MIEVPKYLFEVCVKGLPVCQLLNETVNVCALSVFHIHLSRYHCFPLKIQKMTVAVFFIVSCCITSVVPRSILLNEVSTTLQTETSNITKATEKVDKVVWKKMDAIPLRDFEQHSKSKSGIPGREDFIHPPLKEQKFLEDEQNRTLADEVETATSLNENLQFKTEFQLSTENEVSENSDFSHFDEFTTEEIVESVNSSDDSIISELFEDFHLSNISDSVFDILNRTRDVLGLQQLSEIGNATDVFTFTETDLINDGEIATFHDVSTAGFEFLIDSETTQNLVLAELLRSESLFLNEDDESSNDSTDDNSVLGTTHLASFQEIESDLDNSISDINDLKLKNETTSEIESGNSTEIQMSETKTPKCPPPGWCVFWFMAQDTCAKDSHCLGSRICCKFGCAKTCLDVAS